MLIAIYIMNSINSSFILTCEHNLSFVPFFYKYRVKDLLNFFVLETTDIINPNKRITLKKEILGNTYFLHLYKQQNGLSCCFITDSEYSEKIAHNQIQLELTDFLNHYDNWNTFTKQSHVNWNLHIKIQTLTSTSNLSIIQDKLDKTTEILHENLDIILGTNEKLDNLVKSTDKLNQSSKDFFDKSKKLNSCCLIL